jgi:hypothetical protein
VESSASAPLDAAELLTALARHDVDCVLIGGTAMQVHGHVRTTQDVDVVAAWTVENMGALAAALDELGARLRGVDADLLGIDLTDPRQLHEGGNFLMHTRFGDLDVFAADQTAGAPPTSSCVPARSRSRLLIAHPEDLIRMNSAAAGFRDRPGSANGARSRSRRYRPTAASTSPSATLRLLVDVEFGRCEAATAALVDVPPDGTVL